MWYLLVAAGAGYLAQRWQHTHKSRPLLTGKCQNQRPSSPMSDPATPKRISFSSSAVNDSSAQNGNTNSNGSSDQESSSVDCKASISCFVSGSAEETISKLAAGSPRGNSSSMQVLKSNKRTACEAFLVPVPDAFKPIQGNTNEQTASNPKPNLDFGNIKENTQDQFVCNSRPSLEFSNIQQSTKDQLLFTSKPSPGSANTQGNAEGKVVFSSNSNLDFVNIDNKEQLQGDSTSPSSCCSSLNSPIGRKPIQQKLGSFQFQGKEQRQELNICEQSSTLQNHVAESPSLLEDNASKGRGQGVVLSASKYVFSEAQHTSPWGCEEGFLNPMVVGPRSNINALTSFNAPVFTDDTGTLDASTYRPYVFTGENQRGITRTPVLTNDNGMLDANTHRPYVFTGENQRGATRTDLSNEFMCNDKVKFKMKQVTLSPASDTNCPMKVRSLISPTHGVANESACDAESESLVSFGLAMAVFCMVSSSKREMEKMGKVLKETEDLVSDMRKELEERRAQSFVSSQTLSDDECNEKLLPVMSKDAVTNVFTIEKPNFHTDTLCLLGLSDDESIRSVVTEEHAHYGLHMCDLEAGHEDKLQCVKTNIEGYLNNGNQNEHCDSEEEKDSSTLEETGEDDYVLSMLELERKLWKIFQQRQEEKILELESSLEMALSKLRAKEEELRWWKNRASWLMEHSFVSTSGAISIKDRIEGVEGFNRTAESMKGCDSGEMLSHKFIGDDREYSAGEASFVALEEECIEIVGNEDGPKNSSGHQNQMRRVGSACSISSEESVLSFDARTFTYGIHTT